MTLEEFVYANVGRIYAGNVAHHGAADEDTVVHETITLYKAMKEALSEQD